MAAGARLLRFAWAILFMSLFGIPIFPEQASSFAMDVDALYFFVVAVSSFFALLVAVFGHHLRHQVPPPARG